jgi:CIC family chloride channel protein
VPAFKLNSPWEMGPYVVLGLIAGIVAPWFLRSLRLAERFFVGLKIPLIARLSLGGVIVGGIAVFVPEVCGNGYSVVLSILTGAVGWKILILFFAAKWLATASSFGSGAPGGVFTPTLFMGASVGYLFGVAMHTIWPAVDAQAFALVGMGAFLSAASRAPVMAVIMLFEMTLSYDIIMPLMLCSVIAYYTAKGLTGESLYAEALKRKAAEQPELAALTTGRVADLMKTKPLVLEPGARFAEIARMFINTRVNNLYVIGPDQQLLGVVSLHDIKPYLSEPVLAEVVLARDIMHEDFPRVGPDQTLSEALGGFFNLQAERLPVVTDEGILIGSLAKSDLLLALVEKTKKSKAA